jgi:hypothetical protein
MRPCRDGGASGQTTRSRARTATLTYEQARLWRKFPAIRIWCKIVWRSQVCWLSERCRETGQERTSSTNRADQAIHPDNSSAADERDCTILPAPCWRALQQSFQDSRRGTTQGGTTNRRPPEERTTSSSVCSAQARGGLEPQKRVLHPAGKAPRWPSPDPDGSLRRMGTIEAVSDTRGVGTQNLLCWPRRSIRYRTGAGGSIGATLRRRLLPRLLARANQSG